MIIDAEIDDELLREAKELTGVTNHQELAVLAVNEMLKMIEISEITDFPEYLEQMALSRRFAECSASL
jgi:hypothetical protein